MQSQRVAVGTPGHARVGEARWLQGLLDCVGPELGGRVFDCGLDDLAGGLALAEGPQLRRQRFPPTLFLRRLLLRYYNLCLLLGHGVKLPRARGRPGLSVTLIFIVVVF